MKLSKTQSRDHLRAMDLVNSDRRLTSEERSFILDHYNEAHGQMNSLAGAFFTPDGLARDLAVEASLRRGARLLDLCAGIGRLSHACDREEVEIVCVERCAEYVQVGRRVMPHATWVHADVFDVDLASFGRFDCCVSNPPFGKTVKGEGFKGHYTGSEFEYKVIELASRHAKYGCFIVPQGSSPFQLSGRQRFESNEPEKARQFRTETGIVMEPNCGIDTGLYLSEWKGVSPLCEVVCCEFDEVKPWAPPVVPTTGDLFAGMEA